MMKQIINEAETVQTSLAVKVDDVIVHYRQCNNFAYEFWVYGVCINESEQEANPWLSCTVDEADTAINEVVKALVDQSYNHGAQWCEKYRDAQRSDIERYAVYSVRVTFYLSDVC